MCIGVLTSIFFKSHHVNALRTQSNLFIYFRLPCFNTNVHTFHLQTYVFLQNMSEECTRSLMVCFLWLIKNTERSKLKVWWSSFGPNNLISLLDLLYLCLSCFELKVLYVSRYNKACSCYAPFQYDLLFSPFLVINKINFTLLHTESAFLEADIQMNKRNSFPSVSSWENNM